MSDKPKVVFERDPSKVCGIDIAQFTHKPEILDAKGDIVLLKGLDKFLSILAIKKLLPVPVIQPAKDVYTNVDNPAATGKEEIDEYICRCVYQVLGGPFARRAAKVDGIKRNWTEEKDLLIKVSPLTYLIISAAAQLINEGKSTDALIGYQLTSSELASYAACAKQIKLIDVDQLDEERSEIFLKKTSLAQAIIRENYNKARIKVQNTIYRIINAPREILTNYDLLELEEFAEENPGPEKASLRKRNAAVYLKSARQGLLDAYRANPQSFVFPDLG